MKKLTNSLTQILTYKFISLIFKQGLKGFGTTAKNSKELYGTKTRFYNTYYSYCYDFKIKPLSKFALGMILSPFVKTCRDSDGASYYIFDYLKLSKFVKEIDNLLLDLTKMEKIV